MMSAQSHVRNVRLLYKSILRLHRAMPSELRAIGDQYVKDEFKRHKEADTYQTQQFMQQWTWYYSKLRKQIRKMTADPEEKLGLPLQAQLSDFAGEQIVQLHELYKETQKPRDPQNPLGENPNVPKQNLQDR